MRFAGFVALFLTACGVEEIAPVDAFPDSATPACSVARVSIVEDPADGVPELGLAADALIAAIDADTRGLVYWNEGEPTQGALSQADRRSLEVRAVVPEDPACVAYYEVDIGAALSSGEELDVAFSAVIRLTERGEIWFSSVIPRAYVGGDRAPSFDPASYGDTSLQVDAEYVGREWVGAISWTADAGRVYEEVAQFAFE